MGMKMSNKDKCQLCIIGGSEIRMVSRGRRRASVLLSIGRRRLHHNLDKTLSFKKRVIKIVDNNIVAI